MKDWDTMIGYVFTQQPVQFCVRVPPPSACCSRQAFLAFFQNDRTSAAAGQDAKHAKHLWGLPTRQGCTFPSIHFLLIRLPAMSMGISLCAHGGAYN